MGKEVTMDDERRQVLLSMHNFYADNCNRQLTMMWETVKWFTPVLTIVAGGLVKYLLDGSFSCKSTNEKILLTICSFGGIFLSIFANLLLKRFYTVSMRYVTMFAKVEEELKFDHRETVDRVFFPGDDLINWQEYIEHRAGNHLNQAGTLITSQSVVNNQTNLSTFGFSGKFPFFISTKASIFNYMKLVFYLFMIFFASLITFIYLI
jgi:hypothetical protein